MENILKCPKCNSLLLKKDNSYKCQNNHCFDLSRKGYLFLLLANQKHSDISGDGKFMIDSRTRFLDSEKYSILKNALKDIILSYYHDNFVFGDMACGEGYYTTFIHDALLKKGQCSTYGIDLSKEAISYCSRRQRLMNQSDSSLYVIGNLSYLPFMDESFDLLLNCFAKLEEKEFIRVLKKGGIFIRVLPGSRHLFGIKKAVYDTPYLNEEKDTYIEGLTLTDEKEINGNITLNNEETRDLFTMTPYYYKSPKEGVEKLYSLEKLDTEISFKILIYTKY